MGRRSPIMRNTVGLVAAVLLASVAIGWADEEPKPEGAAAARGVFEKRCASCHVVPDLRFATDRAWLERIRSTA